ncbi:cytochrome-c peroxidase [Hahella sp. CR1]|uniref:cytochrome-c peroxidase n=1 Tax=unclassified Hahella TaxID=2624107 RepID=UPI001C1EB25C|nr:cytochrome c peroxidase [Hahella sp. CR1]MBU6954189.1 hypothetical protein [Hahella sp. HN01]MDG9672109.1 hypothetical protein [Hahella sp. CR1]
MTRSNQNNLLRRSIALTILTSAHALAGPLPTPVVDSDYYDNGDPAPAKYELGRMLFFDKIMSGNRNISCATCHNPLLATTDGLSLGIGEGGRFIGPYRTTGSGDDAVPGRIGRHAPHLYNLGAREFIHLNWQGIMEGNADKPSEISIPAGPEKPGGLDNVLAGQALFPIANINEMIGQRGENEIADSVRPGNGRFRPIWEGYLKRIRAIPEYVELFQAAYPNISLPEDIKIAHYANAIAAFETNAFRADNSRFDQYLRGDVDALSPKEVEGMNLFYGAAGCDSCHSGKFQTDHSFHNIAMPQIGPGPEARMPLEDRGRTEASREQSDFAKFKTPSLRNVAHTAPYGHSGAYASLEGVVRHHLNALESLDNYDTSQTLMPSRSDLDEIDFQGYEDVSLRDKIAQNNELRPNPLSDAEVSALIAFLHTLTDANSLDLRKLIPNQVPSGIAVSD